MSANQKRYDFKSERLVYRAVEPTDEDTKFMHDQCRGGNMLAYAGDMTVWRPPTLKSSKDLATNISEKTLLGVLMCLPPDSPDILPADNELWNPTPAESGKADDDGKPQQAKKPAEPRPVPIGFIALPNQREYNPQNRNGEIAITIAEGYQHKGYGTESINWVLDWGFKFAAFHSMRIGCFTYNTGARKLYERLGFKFEGISREVIYFDGEWHGIVHLSILEDEWRALRKK